MESLKEMLGTLAVLFKRNTDGPFLLGAEASYADMIVGAWLRMMSVTFPEDEWKQVTSWHDGVFGQLHDALGVFRLVK
jgi:glutathione S-transferase